MNIIKQAQALAAEFERLRDFYDQLFKITQKQIVEKLKTIEQPENKNVGEIKSLTDKEREVFDLIKQGLKTKEIGKKLGRKQKTVETQRYAIIGKLGLTSVHELKAYAENN